VVEFNCSATVGVSPDKFDAAAREAWINVTASAVESMSPESITILSVTNSTFNESLPAGNVRRRRLASEPSSDIVMAVSDTMESYGFSDADEFVNHVQTSIVDTYADPGTVVKFVKLAVAKGATRLTNTTTISIDNVAFTPYTTVRVLSGTPTTMPSAIPTSMAVLRGEDTALSTEETIYVTLSVLFFALIVVLLLYFCHFRKSNNNYNESNWTNAAAAEEEEEDVEEDEANLGFGVQKDLDNDEIMLMMEHGRSRQRPKLKAKPQSRASQKYSIDKDSSEWIEKFSERKQKPYWVNSASGESTWKNPVKELNVKDKYKYDKKPSMVSAVGAKPDEWIEKFSDRKLRPYWVNKSTLQSTWKNPFVRKYNSTKVFATSDLDNNNEFADAPFASDARAKSLPNVMSSVDEWVEKYSDRRQKPYWVNVNNGQSTWKAPHDPEVNNQTSNPNGSFSSLKDITKTPEGDDTGAWVEKFDNTRAKPYWKNRLTRVVSWRNPVAPAPEDEDTTLSGPVSLRTMPHVRKSTTSDHSVPDLLGALNFNSPATTSHGEWMEKYSERRQRPYWVHIKDGVSTWKNPYGHDHGLKRDNTSRSNTPDGVFNSLSDRVSAPAVNEVDEWVEKFDKTRMKRYWKNIRTKNLTFNDPRIVES